MAKQYINGVFITEHIFPSGDSQLKINIPQDKLGEFAAQLEKASKDGWCKLVVNKMREPLLSKKTGKTIATHSLAVDDWTPKQSAQQPAQPARQASKPEPQDEQGSEIPF